MSGEDASTRQSMTHGGRAPHEVNNCPQHSPDVFPRIQKAVPLRKGQGTHDIEREKLQPLAQIKNFSVLNEFLVESFTQTLQDFINATLKGRHVRRGEQGCNWGLEPFVHVLVLSVENGLNGTTLGGVGLESRVEGALDGPIQFSIPVYFKGGQWEHVLLENQFVPYRLLESPVDC